MTVQGIDVSRWQGADINWLKVSGQKKFCYIKCTEGVSYIDSMYHTNRWLAKTCGMDVGAYHFARPSKDFTGAQEAHLFLAVAMVQVGELRPALDLEVTGGLNPTELKEWAVDFVQQCKDELGRMPVVYSSPGFWMYKMANTTVLKDMGCPLWVAHYGVSKPTLFGGWAKYRIWQSHQDGIVPGITGEVDLDESPDDLYDMLTYTGPAS